MSENKRNTLEIVTTIITIFIAIFTALLGYLQFKSSEMISKQNEDIENLQFQFQSKISEGELATSLLPYIFSDKKNQQEIAISILASATGDEYAHNILKILSNKKAETADDNEIKMIAQKAYETHTKKTIEKTSLQAEKLNERGLTQQAAEAFYVKSKQFPDTLQKELKEAEVLFESGNYNKAYKTYNRIMQESAVKIAK